MVMTSKDDPATQVTAILQAIDSGNHLAARQLLPLVYSELRDLAAARLRAERPDHTLQSTALVHEAYLRLLGNDTDDSLKWESRGHFFAAAAEAMRRILIDHARQVNAQKRGGDFQRIAIEGLDHPAASRPTELLALDSALDKLQQRDPVKSKLVELRFFAGLTNEQAALALGISESTANRYWTFSKAFLKAEMLES